MRLQCAFAPNGRRKLKTLASPQEWAYLPLWTCTSLFCCVLLKLCRDTVPLEDAPNCGSGEGAVWMMVPTDGWPLYKFLYGFLKLHFWMNRNLQLCYSTEQNSEVIRLDLPPLPSASSQLVYHHLLRLCDVD